MDPARPARVAPGARLFSLFLFAAVLVALSTRAALLLALLTTLALAAALRVPRWGAGRLAWLIPFGAALTLTLPFVTPGPELFRVTLGGWEAVATTTGWLAAQVLLLRLAVVALATGILLARTTESQVLAGLRSLRIPGVFVDLIGFTMRYTSVFADEARRMLTARAARGFQPAPRLWGFQSVRAYGQLLGVLFERAYERSERLYVAMLARSYSVSNSHVQSSTGGVTGFDLAGWAWVGATGIAALALILLDRSLIA